MIDWAVAHWPWLLLAWCLLSLFVVCLCKARARPAPAPTCARPRPLRALDDLGDEIDGVLIEFPTARARRGEDVVA